MNEIVQYSRNALVNFLEESIRIIQHGIRNNPVYKGRPANASGKTAESLHYEIISDNEAVLYGAKHIFVLMFGRKPTQNEGGGGESLKDKIREWIDVKGITPEGNISKDSLAFVIARKIHKEGTLLYRLGQTTTTLTDAINAKRIEELGRELLDQFSVYAISVLIEDLKSEG